MNFQMLHSFSVTSLSGISVVMFVWRGRCSKKIHTPGSETHTPRAAYILSKQRPLSDAGLRLHVSR